MKVRDVMTPSPQCCSLGDSAQTVAKLLNSAGVGCLPVISDDESHFLEGIVTDRDICCKVVSAELDPLTTLIESFMTPDPVTCRSEQSLDSCEKLMQLYRVRRVPVVDDEGRCIGILSQADVARCDNAENANRTVAEISREPEVIIMGSGFDNVSFAIVKSPTPQLQRSTWSWLR
jgi:CBS domain-containing protein